MGRNLHGGGGLTHPVFKHFKLLPELLVAQQGLVQALRLPVEHVTQLLNRPLQVRTFELECLKAHCIIHGHLPGPAQPDPAGLSHSRFPPVY